ncbi:glutathione S-transferase 1-like [Teleopsis dalmanni]|uniref:glutathione S-transferase 1-like n=1 Tax=Teleopsis dalmanni TaxID=139649 RepID=UPI0018CFE027|nr:glutathione S-transferase 1-like [Teleopsis dalmanni]
MGKMILYGTEASPPVRACKLTLEALGLQYEYKLVNLLAGEHKSKEYLLKNPQHTVPLLEDHGKCIWDSHAICAYLVNKYAKTDELYPKEPYARSIVDQRLHFECGVLFQGCIRNIALPVFYKNATEVPREKIDAIYEAYDFLETFLGDDPYICGKKMTIADFSIISTVTSLVGLAPTVPKNLTNWIERMSKLPYYSRANGNGAQMLVDMFSDKIKKII